MITTTSQPTNSTMVPTNSSTTTTSTSVETSTNTIDIDANTNVTLPRSIRCENTTVGNSSDPCAGGKIVISDYIEHSLLRAVNDAYIVIIGTVGSILAKDYHRIHQQHLSDLSQFSPKELEEWLHKERDSYYQIDVREVLRGNPELPFIFRFPDTDYYNPFDYRPLVAGQHVLIFADRVLEPQLFTDKVEVFHGAITPSGIFDIVNNRAFPRDETLFAWGLTKDGDDTIAGELRSYIELERFKLQITMP